MWLMGNLARATYVGSSENLWPWSYAECDRKRQSSQQFSACNRVNHFGMASHRGRGAPEIDIMEGMYTARSLCVSYRNVLSVAMPGDRKLWVTPVDIPYFSSSFQVAPAVDSPSEPIHDSGVVGRPYIGTTPPDGQWYGTSPNRVIVVHNKTTNDSSIDDDFITVVEVPENIRLYEGIHGGGGVEYGPSTSQNVFFYGVRLDRRDGQLDKSYQADALSGMYGCVCN
jgi:hypothetical protein